MDHHGSSTIVVIPWCSNLQIGLYTVYLPSPTAITLGWCDATIGAKATTSGSKLSTTRW